MSKDKYPSIFSPQMEAIVFIINSLNILRNTLCFEKLGIFNNYPAKSRGISSDT